MFSKKLTPILVAATLATSAINVQAQEAQTAPSVPAAQEQLTMEQMVKMQYEMIQMQKEMMAMYANAMNANIAHAAPAKPRVYIDPMLSAAYSDSLITEKKKLSESEIALEKKFWNKMMADYFNMAGGADNMVSEAYNNSLVGQARGLNNPDDYIVVEKELWNTLVKNLKAYGKM